MARKQEVEALKTEVERLNNIVSNLNSELNNETKRRMEAITKSNSLEQSNRFLQDEVYRLQKSDSIHKRLNFDLMHSVAVLGRHIATEQEGEIWHNCSPLSRPQMVEAKNEHRGL